MGILNHGVRPRQINPLTSTPLPFNVSRASLAVAPVVRMSSTTQVGDPLQIQSLWSGCITKADFMFRSRCWRLRWCCPTVERDRLRRFWVRRPRLRQIKIGSGLARFSVFQLGIGTKTALVGKFSPKGRVIALNTLKSFLSRWRRISRRSCPRYQPAA